MKLRRSFSARKLKKNTMDSQTLDKQFTAVALLCNKYLQKDLEAMRLLNKIFNNVADFALIDGKAEDEEFDYAEEMQELIHDFKMLEKDLGKNGLLSMGNYSSETPKETTND